MARVSVRLTDEEANALAQVPGKDTSARVRYLLHQSTLLAAIRHEIARGNGELAVKIAEVSAGGGGEEVISKNEFRLALSVLAQMLIYLTPDASHKQLFKSIAQRIREGSVPK